MNSKTLLPAVVVLVSGCTYLEHRGKDLAQTLHAGAGVSEVPGVSLRATIAPLATSVSYLTRSHYVGTDYAYTSAWQHTETGALILGMAGRSEAGLPSPPPIFPSPFGEAFEDQPEQYLQELTILFFSDPFVNERVVRAYPDHWLNVEVGAHLLFVGLSVGLSPGEFLDFLTGWFGLDLFGDDGYEYFHPEEAPPPEPEPPLEPPLQAPTQAEPAGEAEAAEEPAAEPEPKAAESAPETAPSEPLPEGAGVEAPAPEPEPEPEPEP